MTHSINLNQTFCAMDQVQAYFGSNARITNYGLASEWTTIDVDHYTFTHSSVYGEETYIVVVELIDAADSATIPSIVVDAVQTAVVDIKSFNKRIDDGRSLDKKISGEGRYEHDTFKNISCDLDQHRIVEFARHAYKNGIDPIAHLALIGYEPPATLSAAAMGWA